ncbi:MAG: glycosyltransferase [Ktedonobacteraceae bacterium]|nr:glycosyltransferase [Ktedonobacteraceae bacterium]MBO0789781.1 glycosyltransferase [Ktedonobacteraceae bacterium]
MTTHPYRPSIPDEILALSHQRDQLRRRGQYDRADLLKRQIEEAGYRVKDNPRGAHLATMPGVAVDGHLYRLTRLLPSLLDEADSCTYSVNILGRNNLEQVQRCVESVLRHADSTNLEIILIDNASQDDLGTWAEERKAHEPRLHLLSATRPMGAAEAYNVGMKQSRGRYILLLDPAIELTGNIFTPLENTLQEQQIGATGQRGLSTDNLRHFNESQQREVEAIDCQCMAFRRDWLKKTGLLDERYRFARYMDIDFNFALLDQGARNVVTPHLPLVNHADTQESRLSDAERTRLTKRNFYRFLAKWGDRDDLLTEPEVTG